MKKGWYPVFRVNSTSKKVCKRSHFFFFFIRVKIYFREKGEINDANPRGKENNLNRILFDAC